MWRRKRRIDPQTVPDQVVFPAMLRRCQQVRQEVQRLCAETIALQAALVQLEAQLTGVKEQPAVAPPEEFTYEHRQRG
jgi:hypothetical protein